VLNLADVRHIYHPPAGEVAALDGVSLSVSRGEMVLVRGPSGCGKSTLLMTIGAMLRPTAGTVRFEDTDLYQLEPHQRAAHRSINIGFVFQLFHLVPYLDAINNVLVGAASTSEDEPRARQLLGDFGLTERIHHRPAEMSIGERQRTALARALVHKPALLLADEPTGNLDPENAELVCNALVDFRSEGGTLIVVSHDGDEFAMADRTIEMRSGRIRDV